MVIQSIKILNLGAIEFFEYYFEDDLNIIKNRYTEEISCATQLVLNHRATRLPAFWVSENTEIKAIARISDKKYRIIVRTGIKHNDLDLRAYDEDGKDATHEYLYLTSHCQEQDLCEVFDTATQKMFFKPIQYLDEERYYPLNELSKYTDRLSETKAFRSYLKAFIKDFRPEKIRDGKRYELCLEKSGKYAVCCNNDHNIQIFLSESEQTLFRYLCFLRTAEFWQGFEELRNLHSIKKPILIGNFLERLDESIDIQDILERTKRLNRQIIMLTI